MAALLLRVFARKTNCMLGNQTAAVNELLTWTERKEERNLALDVTNGLVRTKVV
jgi:hypothetical protein